MSFTLLPPAAEAVMTVIIFLFLLFVGLGLANWIFASTYSVLDKGEDWADRIEHKA